jgi:hypothetical protein
MTPLLSYVTDDTVPSVKMWTNCGGGVIYAFLSLLLPFAFSHRQCRTMHFAGHACSLAEKSENFIALGKAMFQYFIRNPTAFLKQQFDCPMFFGVLTASLINFA